MVPPNGNAPSKESPIPAPARSKGKIGVLIEEHFDETEYREFNQYFPARGYEVFYLPHLWGEPSLTFGSNPENGSMNEHVTVSTELQNLDLTDYKAIVASLVVSGQALVDSRPKADRFPRSRKRTLSMSRCFGTRRPESGHVCRHPIG